MQTQHHAGNEREREDEIGRLYDVVRRGLAFGRLDEAEAAANRLLELAPDSTTAHELRGDVLLAQGEREAAMEAFKRALDIEEANVDAERKYAELALEFGDQQRLKADLTDTDLSRFRGAASKEPSVAATRSALFPGLGQLYNGEYEKGIIFAIAAFILLVPAVQALAEIVLGGRGEPGGSWKVWLGWPAIILYVLLYAFSIYDAWRTCQSQDDVGAR